jgi:hypothetical protein
MSRRKPTLDSSWNPKRSEVTYRIGKQGLKNVFLLMGVEDLEELHSLIGKAIEGQHDRPIT